MHASSSTTAARAALMLLLSLACTTLTTAQFDKANCPAFVGDYLKKHSNHLSSAATKDKLTFFLHIPRTAGRVQFMCFFAAHLQSEEICDPWYEEMRDNPDLRCRHMTSHDDYSITDVLPSDTAVVTQLRDPVDRVLSTYENAAELAARVAGLDAEQYEKYIGQYPAYTYWPWKYLIPWFVKDIKTRMTALYALSAKPDSPRPPTWVPLKHPESGELFYFNPKTNERRNELPEPDIVLPLYKSNMIIPLNEWIETPIVKQLVHEGATFQILGITNYSHWREQAYLRRCFEEDAESRYKLTQLAEARLKSMAHVGLTERLDEALLSYAAELGVKLSDKVRGSDITLGEYYPSCAKAMLERTKKQKALSFTTITTPWNEQIDLDPKHRAAIDPAILQRIKELNPVDAAMYALGQELYAKKIEEQKAAGVLESFAAGGVETETEKKDEL